MAYQVIHLKKHKTVQRLGAVSKHNERTRDTPNADPERRDWNERLMGSGDLCADVQARLDQAGIAKVRANGVRAVEHYLSASPEWFQAASPQDIRAWVEASVAWAKDRYGDNLVSLHLHMDERSPNIHAVMVPITPDGRLAATDYFGTPAKVREVHTSYNGAVKHLGLERGVEGSKARHREIQDYYRAIKQPREEAWELARKITIAPAREGEGLEERLARTIASEIAAERTRAQFYRDRATQTERQLAGARERTMRYEYTKEQYGELINQVRGTDLADVMQGLGATRDRHDPHKWDLDGKLINIRGEKFYDFHGQEGDRASRGGGAIDLVRYATGRTFTEAVDYLNSRHYGGRALDTPIRPPEQPRQEPAPALPAIPEDKPERWAEVRRYLVEGRRIPAALVDAAHERGDVYATEYRGYPNAVFVRRDEQGRPVGAVVRGTRGEFHQITRREGVFSIEFGTPNRIERPSLVLVESPIDALSYAALHREGLRYGRVVSTDGRGPLPAAEIDRTLEAGGKVRAAFDNDGPDGGGALLWAAVQHAYFAQTNGPYTPITRELPDAKDWNEQLQQTSGPDREGPRLGPRPGPSMGPSMGR